jgi:hypothetical protein
MKKTCRLAILLVVLIFSSLILLGTLNLSVAASMHLSIKNSKASMSAGTSFTCTVTALDPLNNVVTTYAGNVKFSCTDPNAVLPASAALKSGTGSFTLTLETAGMQTITATDKVDSTLTATASVTVTSGTAKSFDIVVPDFVNPGTLITITVTAKDSYDNFAKGYSGTVDFGSTDSQAVLPATGAITQGRGMFSVTFNTAGTQTVTITDIKDRTLTTTSEITVAASETQPPTSTETPGPSATAVASPTQSAALATPTVEPSVTAAQTNTPETTKIETSFALPVEAIIGIIVIVIVAVVAVGFLIFRKKKAV